jgi:hypothetical protein
MLGGNDFVNSFFGDFTKRPAGLFVKQSVGTRMPDFGILPTSETFWSISLELWHHLVCLFERPHSYSTGTGADRG